MPQGQLESKPESPPAALPQQWWAAKRVSAAEFLLLAVLIAVFLLSGAGSFLIVNAPEPSDVIVALNGQWPKALQLQEQGLAPRILIDADASHPMYGTTEAELLADFMQHTRLPAAEICATSGDSTFDEAADVQRCLRRLDATSALIVTSDFDTRCTLSIFRKRLPQYRWSIAASSAPYHDADQYWKHRIWAKSVLSAWDDFLWWKLVDQWRADVVLR